MQVTHSQRYQRGHSRVPKTDGFGTLIASDHNGDLWNNFLQLTSGEKTAEPNAAKALSFESLQERETLRPQSYIRLLFVLAISSFSDPGKTRNIASGYR
jgi:hypothetical protein